MKLVFENATIQDSIVKACRVAPTRGSAFDKSAGVLITVEDGQVSIRATDELVFYHEIVDAVEVVGEGEWRLPSVLLGGFFSKLRIGSGKTITLEDDPTANVVKAASGSTKAKFRKIDPTYFPSWDAFDADALTPISNLGDRINMVSWACAEGRDSNRLAGIYFDGNLIAATNSFVLATTPCPIESLVDNPIIVPSSAFSNITGAIKEARVGFGQGHMLIMPDDSTQIKVVTIAEEYPKIERGMTRNQPAQVTVEKDHLIEIIERANVFSGSSRAPALTVIIGQEDLAVMMNDEEFNSLGDVIDVTGQATHQRVYIEFIPKNLLDAVRSGPNKNITLHYNPGVTKKAIYIEGGSGYEAWIAPRDRAQVERAEEASKKAEEKA